MEVPEPNLPVNNSIKLKKRAYWASDTYKKKQRKYRPNISAGDCSYVKTLDCVTGMETISTNTIYL